MAYTALCQRAVLRVAVIKINSIRIWDLKMKSHNISSPISSPHVVAIQAKDMVDNRGVLHFVTLG